MAHVLESTAQWSSKCLLPAVRCDGASVTSAARSNCFPSTCPCAAGRDGHDVPPRCTIEQRRCDKADRLFEKLVKETEFERLDGYHALRHSFISVLVAQGKTWDQIAAFVGHLDQRTTQRYIHFMPKDKRETANSIPFEF